jgi:hypothetical protein
LRRRGRLREGTLPQRLAASNVFNKWSYEDPEVRDILLQYSLILPERYCSALWGLE